MHIVIIVQIEGPQVGLFADPVLDTVSVEMGKMQRAPTVHIVARDEFLVGSITIEGATITLIDLPNLLSQSANEIEHCPRVKSHRTIDASETKVARTCSISISASRVV